METMNSTQLLANYKVNVANLKTKQRVCTNHAALQLLADSIVKEESKTSMTKLQPDFKNSPTKTTEEITKSNLIRNWKFPYFDSISNPAKDERLATLFPHPSLSPMIPTPQHSLRQYRSSMSLISSQSADESNFTGIATSTKATRPNTQRRSSMSWTDLFTQAEQVEAKRELINLAAVCYERRGSDPLLDGMLMMHFHTRKTRRSSIDVTNPKNQHLVKAADKKRRQKKRRSQTMPLTSTYVQDDSIPCSSGTVDSVLEYNMKDECSGDQTERAHEKEDVCRWKSRTRRASWSLDPLLTAKNEDRSTGGHELLVEFTDCFIERQRRARTTLPIPKEGR